MKVQILTYKIKDKIWLTLKNIATVIKNKIFDEKQTKYIILKDIKFYNFRLNTPLNIRNIFHVDKLRAASKKSCFPKYQMIII